MKDEVTDLIDALWGLALCRHDTLFSAGCHWNIGPRLARRLSNLILPSRHLFHLNHHRSNCFLPAQPAILHSLLDKILKFPLKREQLPIHISTMYTVWIIGVLRSMILA